MKPEIHLFIIWSKAMHKKNDILQDIQQNFTILQIYNISWSLDNFSKNLSRFYGQNLEKHSEKELHCGDGPFSLIIVKDEFPVYEYRKTSHGWLNINVNTFDAKELYRQWTGGGHKIHGTNNPKETSHDLILLLGTTYKDFESLQSPEWNGEEVPVQDDLVGTGGWKSIQELFFVLNETVNYVVLRNFDCLPDKYTMDAHGDIDILTENHIEIAYISNAKKVFPQKYRVHYEITINEEKVYFDFRYCGDNYYDKAWQKNILTQRVLSNGNFYVPDQVNLYYSLLYHAAVHKKEISNDYIAQLQKMASRIDSKPISRIEFQSPSSIKTYIETFLAASGYEYTDPKDLSVYINRDYINYSSISTLRKYIDIRSKINSVLREIMDGPSKAIYHTRFFISKKRARISQNISSAFWYVCRFRKFKSHLESQFSIQDLTAVKFLDWHHGAYYFTGHLQGEAIFLKTDFLFGLLENEITALNILRRTIPDQLPQYVISDTNPKAPFIATKLIQGVSLCEYYSSISAEEKHSEILHEMVNIINKLNESGIIHRDIRAGNFIVELSTESKAARLKLIDFIFSVGTDKENNIFKELSDTPKNRLILENLGQGNQPEIFVWDDSFALLKTLEKLVPDFQNGYPSLYSQLTDNIGLQTYRWPADNQ